MAIFVVEFKKIGTCYKPRVPFCRLSPNLVDCQHELASIPHSDVSIKKIFDISMGGGKYTAWRGLSGQLFGFSIGGPTDGQLHPFFKSSETGLG